MRQTRQSGVSGQALVELALILPVLLVLIMGAVDFGRVMQARVTSESSAKAGAMWGASHLQNATQSLEPAYALLTAPKNCGSAAGLDFPPSCNVLARACTEARGLQGFSGGTTYVSDDATITYRACTTGSAANVCQPSGSQSNPYFTVTWSHNGTTFTPSLAPGGQTPRIGDALTVTGTYCFKTFFPGPVSRLTWVSPATYTVQP